jgi:hypothetical protein
MGALEAFVQEVVGTMGGVGSAAFAGAAGFVVCAVTGVEIARAARRAVNGRSNIGPPRARL